jgi:hypothetical protein
MGDPPERPAPMPNALAQGRVRRSLKPGSRGTLRWLRQYGDALVCVRHREDPAGLRRVVTVELVVATRHLGAPTTKLDVRARYAVCVAPQDRALQRQLRAIGGRWHPQDGVWYLSGPALREAGLLDLVAFSRQPKRRGRQNLKASTATETGETLGSAKTRGDEDRHL